jgi:hypothetical protein
MMQNTMKVTLTILSVLIAVTFTLMLGSTYGQTGSNNSGTSNQTTSGNTSSQDIGSAQELMKSLGNNTELLTNKTAVGDPNASLAEGMSVESNQTGNQSMQTESQQGANNQTGESANATLSEIGKNVTDAGKTALNKTGEVLQGVGSGAASVLGNITGEIKEGISGK